MKQIRLVKDAYNKRTCIHLSRPFLLIPMLFAIVLILSLSVQADATPPCNVGANNSQPFTTECGAMSTATLVSATAVGNRAWAFGTSSVALGTSTYAGHFASAVGGFADASGDKSTALGVGAKATATNSVAIGRAAWARSDGTISMGFAAGFNNNVSVTDSPEAISIGNRSNIAPGSPGAIAIGGDIDGDNKGAQATAPGAIAIGADMIADKAHTMSVGVPIEVIRDDGTTKILVNEKSAGNSVRTLFNIICDTCTPGFRFNQLLPSNNTWYFRMLQSGNFSVDDPATGTKEAEFRSGGDLRIGGTLIQASSREIKTDFIELDSHDVLDKIDQLPITQWSYKKDQGKVKHIGPVAEDFYQAFGLGDSKTGISSVDTAGVALAAIKALNQEKDTEIAELKAENVKLREKLNVIIAHLKIEK